MPIDYADYPKLWMAISAAIRFGRAQGRCECRGECGLHHGHRCTEKHGQPAKWAKGKVILTVAHLDAPGGPCRCVPKCGCPDHLKAMCQRCHLRYDLRRHVDKARDTRDRKRGIKRLPGFGRTP